MIIIFWVYLNNKKIKETKDLKIILDNLENDTDYSVKVLKIIDGVKSNFSNIVNFRTKSNEPVEILFTYGEYGYSSIVNQVQGGFYKSLRGEQISVV